MFRTPWLFLLAVPVLTWFVLSLRRRRSRSASPLKLLRTVGRTWRVRVWFLPELLVLACLLGLVALLAGPEKLLKSLDQTEQGLAVVLVLDRSGSMAAMVPDGNTRVPRIEGIKAVTRNFLDQRPSDQFALVSFARYPETFTPLTSDRQIVKDFLDLIHVPTRSENDGTAIGDALVLATARLSQLPDKHRGVIVLMTDGQNNFGDKTPLQGAELAAQSGIAVYTIGLGGPGTMTQQTPQGPQTYALPVDIDESTLKAIADKTGGVYYRANSLGDLAGFYRDIAQRQTQKLHIKTPQTAELNLETGLALVFVTLVLAALLRYVVLNRRDP